jgi:hypothetical protein
MDGNKVDILKKHPKVCVSCVGKNERQKDRFTTLFESAMVKGSVSEVLDDSEKVYALRMLCTRHTPCNMSDFENAIDRSLSRTAIFKISMDEVTGKAN